MTKTELRLRLTADLRAAAPDIDQRRASSRAICQAVATHPAWTQAALVCAFLPLPSEPQIAPLWEEGAADARAFCFPRIVQGHVELIRLGDSELLRHATWKLDHAALATAPLVRPEEVDLFLVPGLAFTAGGRRLGRGGGFYDRLLPQRRPQSTAIGICYALQVRDDLPIESHDQDVDAVVTEHGVLGAP